MDPRIELLSAVFELTKRAKDAKRWGVWTNANDPYQRSVDEYFRADSGAEAVTQVTRMETPMLNLSMLIEWALGHDPVTFATLTPPDSASLRAMGGQARADSLTRAFQDFARRTHFAEFYAQHQAFYDSLARTYRATAPGDGAIALLEHFYGGRKADYSIVIAPLVGGGNYGTRIRLPDGEHAYDVGAPAFRDGRYVFDPTNQETLLFHEFGHTFANPAVDSAPNSDKHRDLLPLLLHRMGPQGYTQWHQVMYELMTRTGEVRLLQLYGDTLTARKLEGEYVEEGFVWLPYTLRKLAEYEGNRATYPTFASFIAREFAVLDETEPVIVDGQLRSVRPASSAH